MNESINEVCAPKEKLQRPFFFSLYWDRYVSAVYHSDSCLFLSISPHRFSFQHCPLSRVAWLISFLVGCASKFLPAAIRSFFAAIYWQCSILSGRAAGNTQHLLLRVFARSVDVAVPAVHGSWDDICHHRDFVRATLRPRVQSNPYTMRRLSSTHLTVFRLSQCMNVI
jgi:hypothetical protein